MSRKNSLKRRERAVRKKRRLFDEQEGRCCYCQQPMQFLKMPSQAKIYPENLATWEHLDDRFSPERGKHPGEKRIVLACRKCNHEQSYLRAKEVGIEVHRVRSKRHKNKYAYLAEGIPFQ